MLKLHKSVMLISCCISFFYFGALEHSSFLVHFLCNQGNFYVKCFICIRSYMKLDLGEVESKVF